MNLEQVSLASGVRDAAAPVSAEGTNGLPLQRSMFWRPAYLAPSAWLEHIPFAFWLSETHRPGVFVELGIHHGVSYFAFCQAISLLGFRAQCYGIDTFTGDEHSGSYDGRVYEQVCRHNDTYYSSFSSIVRSTFDDALSHFTDGSVDLLHIDGLHTFEAVRHDFETWLPKLSSRAVVIMHDINVRERNFGVDRFYDSLCCTYPHFEFIHGHGLGVLGVGPNQDELMWQLCSAMQDERICRLIRETFSSLGRGCADCFSADDHRSKARLLSELVERRDRRINELQQHVDRMKSELAASAHQSAETKNKIQVRFEQFAQEKGRLAERADLLKNLCVELRAELSEKQSKLDAALSELQTRLQEGASLMSRQQELEEKANAASLAAASMNQRIERSKVREQQLKQEIQHQKKRIEDRFRELAELTRILEERESILKENEQRDSDILKRAEAMETQLAVLKSENDRLQDELSEHKLRLEDRFKEIAKLTQALQQRDQELAEKEKELDIEKQRTEYFRDMVEAQTVLPAEEPRSAAPQPAPKTRIKTAKKESLGVPAQIALITKSDIFDQSWYLAQYPDVAQTGMDPVKHYVLYGAAEGRQPSPNFDTCWYMATYPDVAEAGINPAVHYIRHGRKEGRAASALNQEPSR
jgi:hypothetical protein